MPTKIKVIFDTGANQHIFNSKKCFDPELFTNNYSTFQTANGREEVHGTGCVRLIIDGEYFMLTNVLYSPGCHYNLFSIKRTVHDGNHVTISPPYNQMVITKPSGTCIIINGDDNELYEKFALIYSSFTQKVAALAAQPIDALHKKISPRK